MANDKLLKISKKHGYKDGGDFIRLAFVVDDLGSSQVAYVMSNKANLFLEDNPWVNISVFFVEDAVPCVEPLFARFNVSDALQYTGRLVATSYGSAKAIKSCTRAKRAFYIQDLAFILNNRVNPDDILKDDSIVKFCRAKDHYEFLKSKGYNVSPVIVEDFDINKILETLSE